MLELENEQGEKYKKVGGWLMLLCFGLFLFGPLGSLVGIIMSFMTLNQYLNQFPEITTIVYIESFLRVILMVLSIRAGIALWEIKPNAVKIAKNYFKILLVFIIIGSFGPLFVGEPIVFNKDTFFSLLSIGIWYSYLSMSKRVKATYNSIEISDELDKNTNDSEISETNDIVVEQIIDDIKEDENIIASTKIEYNFSEIQYYISTNRIKQGPYSYEELKQQSISRNSLIWFKGLGSWKKLKEIEGMNELFEEIPPNIPLIKYSTKFSFNFFYKIKANLISDIREYLIILLISLLMGVIFFTILNNNRQNNIDQEIEKIETEKQQLQEDIEKIEIEKQQLQEDYDKSLEEEEVN